MCNINVLHTRKLQNSLLADKLRVVPMSALLYFIYWLSLIVILIHQQVANISWYVGLTGWFRCLTFPTVRLFGHSKLAVCVDGSPSLCVSIIYLTLGPVSADILSILWPIYTSQNHVTNSVWFTVVMLWALLSEKDQGYSKHHSFCVFRYNWRPTVCKLFIFLHLSQAVINQ